MSEKQPCPVLTNHMGCGRTLCLLNADDRREAEHCPLRTMQSPCLWTQDYDSGAWETTCGETYCFECEGPSANHYRFCPGCGHPLKEAK